MALGRFFLPSLLILAIVLLVLEPAFAGKDYYQLLNVPRDAPTKQIKKAYRDLAAKYHPDKNPGDKDAADKFTEIAKAYEVLTDNEKRRKYDQFGEEGLTQNHQEFRDPFDIFSQFFGGGGHNHGGGKQMRKGETIVIPLQVSLEDLYLGKEYKLAHRKQVLCTQCRGSGAKDADDVKQCPHCKGSGIRVVVQHLAPGFVQQTQTACDKCGGKGKIVKSVCPRCKGKKVEVGEETITVVVERGMPDGATIDFEQQGDEEPEAIPGDVRFRVQTNPHPRFTRKGNDLYYKMSISLLEALTGFKKTVSHLDNHKVVIDRKEITIPGYVLQIADEGMPHHDDPSSHGNLFVEFTVRFPTSLNADQIEGIKKILA
eukprot:TRINITY_DN3080_c0_g1_i1.p1 TRINITY_DN3080_c0_g1~~TRINITY_DN3080_c0_g1_i1.p1  ORF type:complete len:371 (-),score=119.99 TRINITY_DN3080_c0_g1_i1:96-1208(-)